MKTPALATLREHLPLARLGLDKVDLRRRPDLAQLRKRLQPRSAVALTLEAERILVSVVRLSLEDDGHTLTAAAPVPVRAAEVLTNPERAGAVLAAALDAAGLREKRCAVCVPPGWALTASTDLPPVSGEDLRGYLELQAEREFPVALNELRLAHCAYTLPDGKSRAALAALPSRRYEAVEKMLAAANRRALSVSLALGDTLTQPAPMLHLLAAPGQTEVVVTARGGGVAALRSLPGPAAPEAGAEPSALQPGLGEETPAFDPAGFARELRITLGRLPQAVGQQVRRARFGGDPAAAARLRAATQDTLVRLGLETVETADGTTARSANATAESAAVLALQRGPVPFEFVIPQPRKWEAAFVRYNTRRYRWIAGIAAALVFLPVLGFFVRSEQESHLEKRWAAMSGDVADLDALQAAIRRFRPWFEPQPQNLQVIETLFSAFPEQGDVWAKSIQIKPDGGVVCTGFARNRPAILALTDRLRKSQGVSGVQTQSIRGENPIQFTLTYKWAPLHG